ncbi:DUF4132 domain-containing protein [Niastella sp. OAS944]|uniref:DUF4132 domain-containing protein n=1 Tax=Niastella sp. OAS944 TaxID=2664089 RepID=UPI003475953D|nr:hypothetical protein [Chitinophagaceae bacterium OAS944]
MPFTREQLDPLYDTFYYKEFLEPNFSLSYQYLSGKLKQLPVFVELTYNYEFHKLYDLALLPGISPEDEALVFSLLSSAHILHHIRYSIFEQEFKPLIKSNDQAALDRALGVMNKLSVADEEILQWHFKKWNYSKEDILTGSWPVVNFLHACILKMPDDKLDELMYLPHWGSFDSQVFYFLYRNRREKANEYIDNRISNEERINWSIMATLLDLDNDQYVPKCLELIDNCRDRKDMLWAFFSYLQFNDFVKEKNIKELLIRSEEYFEHCINDISQHCLHFSSRVYDMGLHNGVFMPLHAWAVYFTLMNDEAKGKEMLERLLAKRVALKEDVLVMLQHVLGLDAIPYVLAAVFQKDDDKNDERTRVEYIFNELADYKGRYEMNVLWQFDKYENKETLENVIKFLVKEDSLVIERAVKAISHKNKVIRLTAVRILMALDAPEAITVLKSALEKEKDDAVRDLMWQICAWETVAPVTEAMVSTMVESANKRGKLKKAVIPGLDETTLPALYFQGGRKLTGEEVRFILYRMTRANGMNIDAEIKPVLQLIDRVRAADFAKAVFKVFEDKRFKEKDRFLLLLAAFFGNDDMVSKFCVAINKWITRNRRAMCVYGIEALAIQGSNKALRWIEWYARKYRTKKEYLSEAANKALADASQTLGLTTHEMGDRIVPDFGFERLFKHFTVNGEAYRAFIDSKFKLAYFDDDNRSLKSMPAGTDKKLAAEFKTIAKEVRDVVKAQSSRLEHYLVVERKWTFEEWKPFFLNNPIMFIYATKLLWGVYDKGGQLVSCFICQEDTTLINKEGNEIEVPEQYNIGIVHPVLLSAEDLHAWRRQFFDLSIEPVFPQLERPAYKVAEKDRAKRVVQNFGDVPTLTGYIKNTLAEYGWQIGEPGHDNELCEFLKLDHTNSFEVTLEVDGGYVNSYDKETKLEKLYFVDKTVEPYGRDNPLTDQDEYLVQLGKVPIVFYSEVVASIKAIKMVGSKDDSQKK